MKIEEDHRRKVQSVKREFDKKLEEEEKIR